MTYHVHAVEQDLAGKWYARVVISEEESTFLKFDSYPAMEAIQEAAQAFVVANRPELLPERARDEAGRFLPDDPTTPDVNEAWTDAPAE